MKLTTHLHLEPRLRLDGAIPLLHLCLRGVYRENFGSFTCAQLQSPFIALWIQGGSNMTGTGLCVKKPQCAAAVRP